MEILSEKVAEQSKIINEVRALLLLHEWGGDDAVRSGGDYSYGDKGKLEWERDLGREVFALAAEEARRRTARRQAHRALFMEAAHLVAEREERQGRWSRVLPEIAMAVRRKRAIRSIQERQAWQREEAVRRREASAAEEQ